MPSINLPHFGNLLAVELLFLFIGVIYLPVDPMWLIFLLFLAVVFDILALWFAGEWVNDFMEEYFLRLLFVLFLVLFFTFFTEIRVRDATISSVQGYVREGVVGVFSFFGLQNPYEQYLFNRVCHLGDRNCACDVQCPCTNVTGYEVFCGKGFCSCVPRIV